MARSSTGSRSPDAAADGGPSAAALRVLAGAALLGLASPPGVFPGSALLVLPGLALVLDAMRPGGARPGVVYFAGALFFAWISWSLRHLFFGSPLLLIPAVGGWYWLGLARLARGAAARAGRPALLATLACGFALLEWLRATIPGIPYPHAQPAHALYEWPLLLRPLQVVGLVGGNLLLAVVALGLSELIRSRRPQVLSGGLLAWVLLALPVTLPATDGTPIRLGLAQPVLPAYPDQPGYDALQRLEQSEAGRRELVAGFASMAAEGDPVDLWVWPESFAPASLHEDDLGRGIGWLAELGVGGPVLLGMTLVEAVPPVPGAEPEPRGPTRRRNVAVLAASDGRILGRSEKRILVPLGESLPLIPLLPESAQAAVHDLVLGWSGWPMLAMGRVQPPLEFDGRRFGAPICFENAFPHWFRQEVERGASFFCVLSNENWYRGGNELDQLLACTVASALECGRPIARSTTDGWTCAVDALGRIRTRLRPGQREFLRVEVQPRTGTVPALVLAPLLPWLLGLVLVLPFAPSRHRRRVGRSRAPDPDPEADPGPEPAP